MFNIQVEVAIYVTKQESILYYNVHNSLLKLINIMFNYYLYYYNIVIYTNDNIRYACL